MYIKSNIIISMVFYISFVTFMVGMAYMSVGQLPIKCEPYSWSLPLLILVLLSMPAYIGFIVGYDIGKEVNIDKNNNFKR